MALTIVAATSAVAAPLSRDPSRPSWIILQLAPHGTQANIPSTWILDAPAKSRRCEERLQDERSILCRALNSISRQHGAASVRLSAVLVDGVWTSLTQIDPFGLRRAPIPLACIAHSYLSIELSPRRPAQLQ